MRCVLACNLQLVEAIVEVRALAGLGLVRSSALQRSLGQDLLAALCRRVGVGAVACVLPIASLLVLLLDLGVEFSELNLAALALILALRLRQLGLELLLLLQELAILRLELLEVGLGHSQGVVDSSYLTLLLVKDANEVVFDLLLRLFEFLLH